MSTLASAQLEKDVKAESAERCKKIFCTVVGMLEVMPDNEARCIIALLMQHYDNLQG